MTFLYQKSRCLIEAFSLHLKHLLLFLPTTMYEGSNSTSFYEEYYGLHCDELVNAIQEYRKHNGAHKKDEHYLAELLR